jgi:hypothetical protein
MIMNDIDTTGAEMKGASAEYREEMDDCVRRHPESAVLSALFGGLLIGLLILALIPRPTPRSRAAQLLDEVRDEVKNLTGPLMKRGSKLAKQGRRGMLKRLRKSEEMAGDLAGSAQRGWRGLFS